MRDDKRNPFPKFVQHSVALPDSMLAYNPTHEWIFPSIFDTRGCIPNAPARYLLYYSPHNPPGGICLACADSLYGPWTEHGANPIIGKDWEPHYSVSHVASPHAIWMEAEGKLFLYFHGENDVTRWAESSDGVRFGYGGVALDTADVGGVSECSYARVFPRPDGKGYVLFAMGNREGTRHIYLARSKDGRRWRPRHSPFISPHPQSGGQACAGFLFPHKERWYVFHHCDKINEYGDIYAAEVNPSVTRANKPFRVYQAQQDAPDNRRAGAPHPILLDDGRLGFFYEAGRRLEGQIALAVSE